MAPALDSNAVWFVTGCSTGLGQSIAKYVHKAGHTIVATARKLESLQYIRDGPKVLKLSVDVTKPEDITTAINSTVKQFGRLDVVINNAGYIATAELEGFPEDEARKQLETMFWGPVHVTQESIRVFREVNAPHQGGTIIQVSSVGGIMAMQGSPFYHASKFALEGLTRSVRRELNPKLNINLMILSPGGVKTSFADSAKYIPRLPAYKDDPESPMGWFIDYMHDPSLPATWADPDKCAAVLFDAVIGQKDKPLPIRLNLGTDSAGWVRNDLGGLLKEMKDWETETNAVAPSNISSS